MSKRRSYGLATRVASVGLIVLLNVAIFAVVDFAMVKLDILRPPFRYGVPVLGFGRAPTTTSDEYGRTQSFPDSIRIVIGMVGDSHSGVRFDDMLDRHDYVLEAQLREINPAAPVYRTVMGAIDPARLFDAGLYDPKTKTLDVQRWLRAEAYGQTGEDHSHHHGHAHGGSDVNRHSATIRAFCLTYDRPLDWERFNAWIEMLITIYGAGLLRIKGLFHRSIDLRLDFSFCRPGRTCSDNQSQPNNCDR